MATFICRGVNQQDVPHLGDTAHSISRGPNNLPAQRFRVCMACILHRPLRRLADYKPLEHGIPCLEHGYIQCLVCPSPATTER